MEMNFWAAVNSAEVGLKEFLVRSVLLERHLCMSITPKTHVMEDHSITKLVATHGFTDLGKDAGERNHQDEAKADIWLGAIRDYAKKEAFKSKDEVRKNKPKVEAKIAELKIKDKRKSNGEVEGREAVKRQKRIEAREAALACPAPYGTMKTLREICKETMKNN
jgi:hypothetical protein